MVAQYFQHVTSWVFDLDNTLYHPNARLFDQIEVRMSKWVANALNVSHDEANRLRKHYWRSHGTTLAGLMREHDIDPVPYLHDVHDIDLSALEPDAQLAENIAALPGRKIVYTNGSGPYAQNVLAARGLSGIFDAVYGVEHADFHPKPDRLAFETIFAKDGIDATTSAMFEDDIRNLAAPHQMGMKTVHVAPAATAKPFIHHHTDDLTGFLGQLVPAPFPTGRVDAS